MGEMWDIRNRVSNKNIFSVLRPALLVPEGGHGVVRREKGRGLWERNWWGGQVSWGHDPRIRGLEGAWSLLLVGGLSGMCFLKER